MGEIQFRFAERLIAAAILCLLPVSEVVGAELRDEPAVWHENDRAGIEKPKERDPSLAWDITQENVFRPIGRLFHPGRLVRWVGTAFGGDPVPPAANVNQLDEVPNSSWFTNRIGLFPITPETAALGPGAGAPDPAGPWVVIRAKSEGVSPGFTIRDSRGDVYLIKFDPPDFPGTSSAAVISGKIFHASGYNVPEDGVVELNRENLVLDEGVKITLEDGTKRLMTQEDLEGLLDSVSTEPGPIRAIASKYLSGEPVGPFDWLHRRKDDPNDHVDHEERRELRGLKIIAGWLNHFDVKQLNTLDMYVEEDGKQFVRHHLIDFASSLGGGATGPKAPFGYEYSIDGWAILGGTFALVFHDDRWRCLERPEGLDEIGYFESTHFRPHKFKGQYPNSAFANFTDRDGYWAAKIISAFTDDHLRAVVETGKYRNPEAERYMVRMLGERRDKTARHWFDRVPPLDFFTFDGYTLEFHDLGEERGIYPGTTPRYRVMVAPVDLDRNGQGWSGWMEVETPEVDLGDPGIRAVVDGSQPSEYPFLAFRLQVNRGNGWSSTITAFASRESLWIVGLVR
jgi:hypothetical protein